jgi:hypothetical protein
VEVRDEEAAVHLQGLRFSSQNPFAERVANGRVSDQARPERVGTIKNSLGPDDGVKPPELRSEVIALSQVKQLG